MTVNARELRHRRGELIDKAQGMVKNAEIEDRDFTDEEQAKYDDMLAQVGQMEARAKRLENMEGLRGAVDAKKAPAFNKTTKGDSEVRATAHFVRTGDVGAVAGLTSEDRDGKWLVLDFPSAAEMQQRGLINAQFRAVDSTMNITTDADGGVTVPVGLAPTIAMRMNEKALYNRLGCQMIPGVGTTVNHVYENADPVVFATTSEQADDLSTNDYERDAMVLAEKAFTLVKKTKKLHLTEELLLDNDVNLMDSIATWIGKNMAVTMNSVLLTEVAANGTAFKTYASASAIAAGEPEDIVFNDTLGYYLDDGSNAAWVMRPSTFGNVASITGNARLYAETPGGSFAKELLGYPTLYSNQAAATAASAKDIYFGDWFNVGYRLAPELRLLVDPYSEDGVTVLKYMFRTVFGVLQAGAIGYGVHPSA